MAQNITTTQYLTATNGNYSDTFQVSSQFSQTTLGASAGIATVATGASLFPGSVSTNGWLALRNLAVATAGANPTVQYGVKPTGSTFLPVGASQPGEPSILRLDPSCTLWWQVQPGTLPTGSTTISVQYLLLNN
jgi:hypothetical protein